MPFFASVNKSLAKFYDGRRDLFKKLEVKSRSLKNPVWIHAASLGEYEQAVPIIDYLNKKQQDVVVSFFSPSGFDIKKDDKKLAAVTYLPIDTSQNMKEFVEILNPKLALIIKYEVWPNMLQALQNKNIPKILVSATFSKHQLYFKWYGSLFLKALQKFDAVFVQNEDSFRLAQELQLKGIHISGDTRYDRVFNQLEQDNFIKGVSEFIGDQPCLICGSTWPEDENFIINYINQTHQQLKVIIAPHKVNTAHIEAIENSLKVDYIKWSDGIHTTNLNQAQVVIIDCIGLLTKLYSYANIAYVGGAVGTTGLHNILEPSTFGVPVLFGENHQKFPEAKALLNAGGALEVKHQTDFNSNLDDLISNREKRLEIGEKSAQFVKKQTGATTLICNYIEEQLKQ